MPEPDAVGGRRYSFFGGRTQNFNLGAGLGVDIPALKSVATDLGNLADAIGKLKSSLQNFGSNAGDKINSSLEKIETQAKKTAGAVAAVSAAAAGIGAAAGRTAAVGTVAAPAAAAAPAGTSTGWASQATSAASTAIASVAQQGQGSLARALQPTLPGQGMAANLALAPLRWMRERLSTNREVQMMGSMNLGMLARQQGIGGEQAGAAGNIGWGGMFEAMSRFPGGVMGNPQELIQLFSLLPQLGAQFGFRGQMAPGQAGPPSFQGQGVRGAGLFQGLQQMQRLNPGATMGSMVSTLGGQAANTQAQQQAVMMTGGAYSMIKQGGAQKSLSEWSEGVLKWLQNLRPGSKRGKPFSYGELLAQQFPGSNIDAWFEMNGVNQGMRDYWWTYVLGKTNAGKASDEEWKDIAPDKTSTAYQRMRSGAELTRTEFSLAGQMSGAYANREQMNAWFNKMMGQMQMLFLPGLAAGAGGFMQWMPDSIEDLMMGMAEWGGNLLSGGSGDVEPADLGDMGGYGETGGTGLAGLSPNMRSKLGPMLKANPRLRVNSGLRDTAMQKRLRDRGHTRVSGKPSAHTRGDAADLGPPSEYEWVQRNAKKYGLKSGARAGEPWHVGVGDVDFSTEGIMKILSGFMGVGGSVMGGILSGVGSTAGSIADFSTNILGIFGSFLSGMMGGGAGGGAGPKFTDLTGMPTKIPITPQQGISSFSELLNMVKENLTGTPSSGGEGGLLSGEGAGGTGAGIMGGGGSGSSDFAPGAKLTTNELAKLTRTKFDREDSTLMTAIALAESGGRSDAYNPNRSTGDKSYGLWQINMIDKLGPDRRQKYGLATNEELFDPEKNLEVAYDMSGGGTNFGPWSTWKRGEHKPFMAEATAAVGAVGDFDSYSAMRYQAMMPGTPSGSAGRAITFQNTFNIQGGGSGIGGVDVRRVATLVADHLENEMQRRMSRAS